MSAPRAICTSMECSGVKKCELPSRCRAELNRPRLETLPQLGQRENLKAAGVGKHGAGPTDELVQAAHAADGFMTWAEIEVVGVAEDYLRAERFKNILRDGLDGACCADGHKDRRLDDLMRQMQGRCGAPRGRGCVEQVEVEVAMVASSWAIRGVNSAQLGDFRAEIEEETDGIGLVSGGDAEGGEQLFHGAA